MKVIVESGATKSDWRLITDNGDEKARLIRAGMNVSIMQLQEIEATLREAGCKMQQTASEEITSIHFYIAGVITEEIEAALQAILKNIFKEADVEIQNDLVAAARAVCGHKPGIAAILGTGSNSCQWDGTKIVKRVYTGGFILGDEGSAATLGKLFIADFLKGLVPSEISEDFSSRFPSDYSTIIANVYRSENSPSGYLGSFTPFIMEHYNHPYIKEMVDGNFRAFIRRCIKQYDTDKYNVGIVGGFGYALREIIERIAAEEGISISKFIKAPIDGLIEYHS